MSSTPSPGMPNSPLQSEKDRRYDRQLRLWGDHGQVHTHTDIHLGRRTEGKTAQSRHTDRQQYIDRQKNIYLQRQTDRKRKYNFRKTGEEIYTKTDRHIDKIRQRHRQGQKERYDTKGNRQKETTDTFTDELTDFLYYNVIHAVKSEYFHSVQM